jgi:transposase-like protein
MGLIAKQYQTVEAAREYLESILWPDAPICPHCGVIGEATGLTLQKKGIRDGETVEFSTHARTGTYQCNGCRKQFSVTVGTIFEDSKIPLHKWLLAIHLMCSSKKGVSALQLQRELELGSYRSAWFMCHRIRWAMTQSPMAEALKMMSGVVEVDETYVGGKEKGKRGMPGPESKKTPVLALVQRGGDVRSFPIQRATLKNIRPILEKNIDPETHLVTDEAAVYYMMKPSFANHSTVNHAKKEYARKEADFNVTTNTVESFFAILKRSVYGIHHHMSRKYLPSYCSERDFVYNGRKLSDDERTLKAVKAIRRKRLMLNAPKRAE